ncbi:ATP-binding cassette domain-containing protein [Clostridium formicaceticum]|uniref:ABC transporter n=1 Tax=Clostridium formicaceticum TaxID=1497 RepID=A0AAC9RJS0_9CLOT|nr:ABC transporter ATP-binding protein [Clostridium formicaceticum]AOY77795.1 ABC transporter [Clostridium formicaceticum]ARE88401.1 Bicarbonate transport ATP-binding protein CmpD [Clostridium formicaceticum]
MKEYILSTTLDQIVKEHPYVEDFFISIGIRNFHTSLTIEELLYNLADDFLEDCGMEREQILNHFIGFMEKISELKRQSSLTIEEITVIGGQDKSGNHENVTLTMKPGEIICIVGATGSGKSRLLADIECLAQKDTPTGRRVLLNGEIPPLDKRFSIEHKLVAQLSQNMNFIMDLTVEEFVTMHAESRMVSHIDQAVQMIAQCANELAGEKFTMDTPVTALSGGQSRALMIADTALLSTSPIVLIDEIENAGVDRKKALELLVKKEKIVLMSTHDPILALLGDKRIVIKNGGISKIIETSQVERGNLKLLQRLDARLVELRNMLRRGKKIEFDARDFFEI